jgi:hypothetical protein
MSLQKIMDAELDEVNYITGVYMFLGSAFPCNDTCPTVPFREGGLAK